MSRKKSQRRLQQLGKLQRRRQAVGANSAASQGRSLLNRADQLMQRRSWQQARELLEEDYEAHPGRRDVMHRLLDVYHEQQDYEPYCRVASQLVEAEPDHPPYQLMLAGGYLGCGRPASALQAFRSYLRRWPDDPLAEGARETIEQLERTVALLVEHLHLEGSQAEQCAALHEEVLAALAGREYQRPIQAGEQLLELRPAFLPVMNNLAELYFRSGKAEQALDMSRRVLDREPENIQALSNLARHLLLTGQPAEAQATADRLRSVPPRRGEDWCKKCEAFSFLGDDDAVLSVFAAAVDEGDLHDESPADALLYHLAAVASARQGHAREAQRCWKKALTIWPGFDLAEQNLADGNQPIAARHGPWYYSLDYWLSEPAREDIFRRLESINRSHATGLAEIVHREAREILKAHPEIICVVPALLDRGDPSATHLAVALAMASESPQLLEAVRTFCLSDRGPDQLRISTATTLSRDGVLEGGPVRMWLNGKWEMPELNTFEITDEPDEEMLHSPEVDDWLHESIQAHRQGDGAAAERLLRKCIAREGELPDLLNNLAGALSLQGRSEEAVALVKQIHERWPEYFFGIIAMANMATIEGEYERAEQYLAGLHRRQRFHTTEFVALASAHIQLSIESKHPEAARRWVDMWRQVDPDHPELMALERRLAARPFSRWLWRG